MFIEVHTKRTGQAWKANILLIVYYADYEIQMIGDQQAAHIQETAEEIDKKISEAFQELA